MEPDFLFQDAQATRKTSPVLPVCPSVRGVSSDEDDVVFGHVSVRTALASSAHRAASGAAAALASSSSAHRVVDLYSRCHGDSVQVEVWMPLLGRRVAAASSASDGTTAASRMQLGTTCSESNECFLGDGGDSEWAATHYSTRGLSIASADPESCENTVLLIPANIERKQLPLARMTTIKTGASAVKCDGRVLCLTDSCH